MPRPRKKRFSNPRSRRRSGDQKTTSPAQSRAPAQAQAQAPPTPDASPSSNAGSDHDHDHPAPPFFNTTFSTHRVSSLYIGPQPLSRDRLDVLTRRLRDVLVGDSVRGIQVGIDGGGGENDSSMGRAGALEVVEMRWVPLGVVLGQQPADGGEEDSQTDATQRPVSRDLGIDTRPDFGRGLWRRRRALCISLQYENALCTAMLMPSLPGSGEEPGRDGAHKDTDPSSTTLFGTSTSTSDKHFLHLPLLLLRMPPPLKPIMVDFISSTFDCRIQPLRLGTRSLAQAWERWLRDAGAPSRGSLAKDAVITLGFYAPSIVSDKASSGKKQTEEDSESAAADPVAMGIKAIDVIVPAADIKKFAKAGKRARTEDEDESGRGSRDARKRRKLGGRTDEEGWWWRKSAEASSDEADATAEQPFLEALARYINHHLALDVFHPTVRITRVACGAFVLSEGRVKVFASTDPTDGQNIMPAVQQRGVEGLVASLVDKAVGKRLSSL